MKYNLAVVLLFLVSCYSNKVIYIYNDFNSEKDNIKEIPKCISDLSKLEIVESKQGSDIYWIEYAGIDSDISSVHKFILYDKNGKYLGQYYNYLINLSKFENEKDFFSSSIEKLSIDNISFLECKFKTNKKNDKILIIKNTEYLLKEYCPHDLSPKDRTRVFYYNKIFPSNIPNHAILIEKSNKYKFLYKWLVYEKTERLSDDRAKILMNEYTYEGLLIDSFIFEIEIQDSVNLQNYSILTDLFSDEYVFINNGIHYPILSRYSSKFK